jgi:hypothetical protein
MSNNTIEKIVTRKKSTKNQYLMMKLKNKSEKKTKKNESG